MQAVNGPFMPDRLSVVAVVALTASAAAGGIDRDRLEARLSLMGCPGALVGEFPDEGLPASVAIGVGDVGSGLPMRVDMRLRIGSVSKLFVGTAALRLVDRGLLSLDDRVSEHVEGVPEGDRITVRMLGNQTSGLFDPIADPGFQAEIIKEPRRLWRPTEALAYSYRRLLRNQPGAVFRYGNAGTIVLGQVLVAVTGKPLPEVVQEEVCDPLHLEGTGFCREASPPPPTPSSYRFGAGGRWLGYGQVFVDVSGYSASWTSWAGDMYSTVTDLGRAAR
ncbi:MAG: serine hydrolase domain-containing protein, partial [Planctomycetota bacterium]